MQQTIQLFINDQLVDLSDKSTIALSFQINELIDVKNQQGNTSNRFNLPLTQRNRIILGFPDDITIDTIAPYRQYSAKLVQNGIEIVPVGIAELYQVENNMAMIAVLSGNVDFFDTIDGQIYDAGDSTSQFSDYGRNKVWDDVSKDCVWDVAHVAGSQKKTDGWIWPIVDYGAIGLNDFTVPINVRMQRPGFFLHSAIELFAKFAGYRIDYERSSLMRDPLYNKLIVQFANSSFEHGTDYQNTPATNGMSTTNSVNQVITNPADGTINFNKGYYEATENVELTATLLFDIYIRGRYTGHQPMEVDIKYVLIDVDGAAHDFAATSFQLDSTYNHLGGSGNAVYGEQTFKNQKISYDFSLVKGQRIYVKWKINNVGSPALPLSTYVVFYKGAQFTIEPSEKNVLYGQQIQCERILPDISAKDLLKDALQMFGIICQSDNVTKKITFASFKDIVANIPKALDWSDKCVDMGKQVYFQLGNYSRTNWMRYQFDDSVPVNQMQKYFADDKVIVDDRTLNPSNPVQDLFVRQFAPSINRPFIGGSIAQILQIDTINSPSEFSIGTQPRLLVDQKYTLKQRADGTKETVKFTDGDSANDVIVDDVISIPYFFKPDGEYNLCYCDKGGQTGLRKKYYQELEHILKRTKKVVRYFMLTPQDIKDLDFLIPVYLRQESAYFYINTVDSWIHGQPCKVELIKL